MNDRHDERPRPAGHEQDDGRQVPGRVEILAYDATMARHDAGIGTDGQQAPPSHWDAYMGRVIEILNEELGSIRHAAQGGARETDADLGHVTDGVWPYAKRCLEGLGFDVLNSLDARYNRVGAKISW